MENKTINTIMILTGLMALVSLTTYSIIYPIDTYLGKMFGLTGLMLFFVFTLQNIIVLPCMDKKPQEVK